MLLEGFIVNNLGSGQTTSKDVDLSGFILFASI